MKAFLKSFLASLLAITSLVMVIVIVVVIQSNKKPKIKDHSYLVIDIYGEILEYSPPSEFPGQILGRTPETLDRILENLNKAGVDERIDGVILKLSSSNTAGYAKLEEIRAAVKKVRDAGKKVYCFSDFLDRKACYLASACDSIYMPPMAFVDFTGFRITSQHFKKTMDKLGVKPNLHRIKDYKGAAEILTRENMSAEVRRNREWILDEFWDMFIQALEEDRGLEEEDIVQLMNLAIFMPEEAQHAGLIDHLAYWDELKERLKQKKDKKLRTVTQARYDDEDPAKFGIKGEKKIAVVHAQGTIGGRKSRIDPVFGVMMGHESMADILRQVRRNKDIAAVVFRVDSPGGDGTASDMIGYEVEATSKVKPTVISMVDVAASGGYAISYRANKIVADPMTLTGSIGSISGKVNMKGLYDKLGITYDFVTKGPMALFWSDYRDFTEKEWSRFVENHWTYFNSWLQSVAEHRSMTFEEAEKLAHGRVWTGRQAEGNGLVDELGGLDRAIEVAKELADIPAADNVTVLHYPKQKSLWGSILSGDANVSAAARWLLFNFIHHDLAQTVKAMSDRPQLLFDDTTVQ